VCAAGDNFLLEMDGLGYLKDDLVCNFWANRSFGCSHCKSEEAVRRDVRLHALSVSMPPGRPKSGRVAMCKSHPKLGAVVSASGVSYTVDAGEFWTT
jgi:hypothetical protein